MQSEDKTVLFAVGSTLVNCTNSYDVEKPDPQMLELAKYAKQHVPEEHPKVLLKSSFAHEQTYLPSMRLVCYITSIYFHFSMCLTLCFVCFS